MTTKTCSGCGQTKPIEMFSKMTRASDGRQPKCKACNAEYVKNKRCSREQTRAETHPWRQYPA